MLGVLGGLDFPDRDLKNWAESAQVVYAADSAADRLVPMGIRPVIVGDLDSVSQGSLQPDLRIVRSADPDTTDCDKLLDLAVSDGHAALTLTCVEGDLLDHMLATLSSVSKSPIHVRVVTRRLIGHVLKPGFTMTVPDGFGRRVSLIPLARSTGVSLTGVLWEVQDSVMEPGGFLSVSNEGTGEVAASLSTGSAVLFVERRQEEPPIW